MASQNLSEDGKNGRPDKSILLVDDEPDILKVCQLGLAKSFAVEAFPDPEKALERFRHDPFAFDLVLTDVRMPRMNGFQLASEIRAIRRDIPMMFMSAFEITPDEYKSVYPLARNSILSKPVSLQKLVEIVSQAIKQKER